MAEATPPRRLIIYTDGASRGNPGRAAIGVVVQDDSGQTLVEQGRTIGRATNNVAEYRAVLHALDLAAQLHATEVHLRLDSELVQLQLLGLYRVKSPDLRPLYEQVVARCRQLRKFTVEHIPRHLNARADALANAALNENRRST